MELPSGREKQTVTCIVWPLMWPPVRCLCTLVTSTTRHGYMPEKRKEKQSRKKKKKSFVLGSFQLLRWPQVKYNTSNMMCTICDDSLLVAIFLSISTFSRGGNLPLKNYCCTSKKRLMDPKKVSLKLSLKKKYIKGHSLSLALNHDQNVMSLLMTELQSTLTSIMSFSNC